MLGRVGRNGLIAVVLAVATAAMADTAGAVLSGTNGNIVFVSGRGDANDNEAKLFLRHTSGSFGGLPTTGLPLNTTAGQHRHPTWSPDRTRIAYARGGPSCATDCDIYVLDLTTPGATPVNITNTSNVDEDRPAWSPDGTRIAFESEVAAASNQLDVLVDSEPFGTGTNLNLTNTGGAGQIEGKPAWSPDSQTLYYARGNVFVAPGLNEADSANIYREPADNSGAPALAVANVSGAHHFQPSISPDGGRICYTLSTEAGLGNSAAVMLGDLTTPPSAGNVLASEPGVGHYNCTWAPNGTQVAYVRGIFGTGDLYLKNLNNPVLGIPLEESNRFDGNPDWAPDARPQCEDQTITTSVDTAVTVPLTCADTGPDYERTPLRGIAVNPATGTVSPETAQDLPANVTYTPAPGFVGTDTFTIRSFDAGGFGDRNGTVTVNVVRGQEAAPGFSLGKVKRNKRKGTAKLTVNVDAPGDLVLARTKKLKRATKRAGSQGSLKLVLKPRGKAKRKLAESGHARVKAEVTYTADGFDPSAKSKRVKLKRKRR